MSAPLLTVDSISKLYGSGCTHCNKASGPDFGSNICNHCGTVVACSDISFSLHAGEVLGIVGESGSGKSTVMRILHFDIEASNGTMQLSIDRKQAGTGKQSGGINGTSRMPQIVAGQNILECSSYAKRQLRNSCMGIVYQNPMLGLRMHFSASGNVAERLLMAGWNHVGSMRDRARSLFERTEVDIGRMDEPPISFSGGMQQRVQIARALSNSPMLLLLDEVTTGLDVSVQARVLDLLRSLTRELGLATIVVSHDLGVIRLLSSRTLVMKNGRIIEAGLTNQILEDPQHPYTQLLVSSAL